MVCETFIREASTVIESENLENVNITTYSASKLHLRMNWDEIVRVLKTNEKDGKACRRSRRDH